ncbi:fibronectin type III-like domain-contianing protein [Snuella lapsa]|uniref:Fibronectin type III-like domain-containing protein n=1 Tax=Snuella lapsa TaxID=870481 RepID=A0ABP6YP51_9FLAO
MTQAMSNKVHVTVSNNGAFDGETVVQLYIRDKEAIVATPLRTLKRFKKIFLKAGASKTVTFEITQEDLAITDNEGHQIIEPGCLKFMWGRIQKQQIKR